MPIPDIHPLHQSCHHHPQNQQLMRKDDCPSARGSPHQRHYRFLHNETVSREADPESKRKQEELHSSLGRGRPTSHANCEKRHQFLLPQVQHGEESGVGPLAGRGMAAMHCSAAGCSRRAWLLSSAHTTWIWWMHNAMVPCCTRGFIFKQDGADSSH